MCLLGQGKQPSPTNYLRGLTPHCLRKLQCPLLRQLPCKTMFIHLRTNHYHSSLFLNLLTNTKSQQDSCILLGGIITLLLSSLGDKVWFKEMYRGVELTRDELVMVICKCSCHYKTGLRNLPCPLLSCVDTAKRWQSATRKQDLTKYQICQCLGLSSLQSVKNKLMLFVNCSVYIVLPCFIFCYISLN